MVVIGAGVPGVGNTSRVLGPNAFADTLNLTFASADSVGFDFYPGPSAGNVSISVFSAANVLLGSFLINAPLGPSFFGWIAPNALRDMFRRVHIGIDTMQTGPAVRTYNIMIGERRRVAAALIAVP